MRTTKDYINSMLPCRIDKIIEYADRQMYSYTYDAYPSSWEIKQEVIEMYNTRQIDIMFTRSGHPVAVYSNWKIGCKMK